MVDNELTLYKNSVGLQFSEHHLDLLVHLHVEIVGGHYAVPNDIVLAKAPELYFNKLKRERNFRKLRKNHEKNSESRKRIEKELYDLKTKSLLFFHKLEKEDN